MKKAVWSALLLLGTLSTAWSYKILYAEQWFELVHRHLYEDADSSLENIRYLEEALKADFANPQNALARVTNPTEWERYRYLFYTQTCLLLIEQHLMLAKNFDKKEAYFYNAPWKEANLESLQKAEEVYRFALVYWEKAREWAEKANAMKYVLLDDIQFWIDRAARIESGDLDYGFIVGRHLDRLAKVRARFEAMDASTY